MPAITAERMRREFTSAAASAASWDQWEYEEWASLPDLAIQWLARLPNSIEAGARWPQHTKWGKAFFLSKVQGFTTDPMDFRVLLILARLYRRWAGLR